MKKIKAHMVCHTHWDREWYFTREEFRVKLVRLIDGLLDIVENNNEYASFMLDGQTIAIEDYLEIKPKNRERLKNALSSGKIICGPWYILPDELLVSGESHIRNYIMGKKVLENMAPQMKVAYLPDSFGHPAQMPQIINGLGMEAMVFWRGTANYMKNTEFFWESPGGLTKTLCIHMPSGYGNSGRLSNDADKGIPRLESMISKLAEKSTTDIVLLMNGSDHITGQSDIVEIVKLFNSHASNAFIKLSTLEEFMKEINPRLKGIETYKGEFRYGERSLLLGGTLSTRMPLKIKNHIVQSSMEKYIEPMLAFEYLFSGNSVQSDYCNYIWKKILENHPHDSICGCSIDEVHDEMDTRFVSLRKLQATIFSDVFRRVETLLPSGEAKADAQCILYEPSQDKLNAYVEFSVDMDRMLIQEVNFEKSTIEDYESQIKHPEIPVNLHITDQAGREIEHFIISAEKTYDTDYQDETLPEVYKVNRIRIGALLPGFAFGCHILNIYRLDNVKTEAEVKIKVELKTEENEKKQSNIFFIENNFYKISFKGTDFEVVDKKTGKVHEGVHKLVDKGDAGDEYTYSWPEYDSNYHIDKDNLSFEVDKNEIVERLTVKGNLVLPRELTENRKQRSEVMVENPISIAVSLSKGIDRIDFHTEIQNNAFDHRIQVEFPSGILTEKSVSEHCFSLVKRDIELVIPEEWAEYPQSTHPTHGYTALHNDDYGISFSSDGLTEYEAENTDGQSMLRVTLLRCVGWLSRTDLLTRKGNGGWTIATPDAQLIGNHCFDYCITYNGGNAFKNDAYSLLYKKIYPAGITQMKKSPGNVRVQNIFEFISDLPKEVRVSALKISEMENSIILRLFNLSSNHKVIDLKLPDSIGKVFKTNMVEKRISEIDYKEGNLNLSIAPSEILTLEFL